MLSNLMSLMTFYFTNKIYTPYPYSKQSTLKQSQSKFFWKDLQEATSLIVSQLDFFKYFYICVEFGKIIMSSYPILILLKLLYGQDRETGYDTFSISCLNIMFDAPKG